MMRLFTLITLSIWSLLSCGPQPPASSGALATSKGPEGATGQLAGTSWELGVHYEMLAPAQPTNVGPGKVEVVEFFSYGCPSCYTLEPHLVLWNRRKPDYIQLARIPASWQPEKLAHARLYYTLQALGRDDLHHDVFDTIHRRGNRLAAQDEEQTFKLQLEFALAHGIGAEEFTGAYHSSTVASNLQLARQLAQRSKITGVPSIVINGKYKTSYARAGDEPHLIALTNDLATSEAQP